MPRPKMNKENYCTMNKQLLLLISLTSLISTPARVRKGLGPRVTTIQCASEEVFKEKLMLRDVIMQGYFWRYFRVQMHKLKDPNNPDKLNDPLQLPDTILELSKVANMPGTITLFDVFLYGGSEAQLELDLLRSSSLDAFEMSFEVLLNATVKGSFELDMEKTVLDGAFTLNMTSARLKGSQRLLAMPNVALTTAALHVGPTELQLNYSDVEIRLHSERSDPILVATMEGALDAMFEKSIKDLDIQGEANNMVITFVETFLGKCQNDFDNSSPFRNLFNDNENDLLSNIV